MSSATTTSSMSYYIPHAARWPIVGSVALFIFFYGFATWLNGRPLGKEMFIAGLVLVMFFAAFFGALFYARIFSGPWLGGIGGGGADVTNAVLYSGHDYVWPSNGPNEVGGDFTQMGWFGLPLINTLLLLTSGLTCTLAHHAIRVGNRSKFVLWLLATVSLGFLFVGLQALEYYEAYAHLNLKMSSGIYGSTFFLLTGFHGFHVSMGAIILLVVMFRGMKSHFTQTNHFAFEAAAWYWHFVDVVWLGLFIFVYLM